MISSFFILPHVSNNDICHIGSPRNKFIYLFPPCLSVDILLHLWPYSHELGNDVENFCKQLGRFFSRMFICLTIGGNITSYWSMALECRVNWESCADWRPPIDLLLITPAGQWQWRVAAVFPTCLLSLWFAGPSFQLSLQAFTASDFIF